VVRKRAIASGSAGIPDRLREARERLYLSQSKLSLLAGLGRITVNNIEERRSKGNVGVVMLEKLSKVLRVSPAWLAFGIGSSEMVFAADEDEPAKPHNSSAPQQRGPNLDQ
jgi:transcriptional regulator with XRE-family HTH domain